MLTGRSQQVRGVNAAARECIGELFARSVGPHHTHSLSGGPKQCHIERGVARPAGRHLASFEFVELPEIAGVGADENTARVEPAIEAFIEARRVERYDLIAQMHGGGRYSNAFVNRLGARVTIGTRTDDAASNDRALGYVSYQDEVMRWLEIASLVGATPVVVHPGATGPRRPWPAEHFAQLICELEREGMGVVLVGHGAGDAAVKCVSVSSPQRRPAGEFARLSRCSSHSWLSSAVRDSENSNRRGTEGCIQIVRCRSSEIHVNAKLSCNANFASVTVRKCVRKESSNSNLSRLA